MQYLNFGLHTTSLVFDRPYRAGANSDHSQGLTTPAMIFRPQADLVKSYPEAMVITPTKDSENFIRKLVLQ